MPAKSFPQITKARLDKLGGYFGEQVLRGHDFVCVSYSECKASCADLSFYPGQLHHVGTHYDLEIDGEPLRIVIVGQEYGGGDDLPFDLDRRHEAILESASVGWRGRNAHMKGTTTLLRLFHQREPGTDESGEQVLLDSDETIHLFEGFALVNFLLCSAVKPGKTRGYASNTMTANCARHFKKAIEILEPNFIVLQGHTVRQWVGRAYQCPWEGQNTEWLDLDGKQTRVFTFYHPSAPAGLWWGQSVQSLYLNNTIVPAIASIRGPSAGLASCG
jgi:hypothetical protein